MTETPAGGETTPRRPNAGRWIVMAAAALVVFGLDLVTKILVRDRITPGERIDLLPGVDLVHITNRGVAFGAFAGSPRIVAVLTTVVLVVLAVWLVRIGDEGVAVMLGGGLLAGGAVGNLIDRLARGGVTDFVDIGRWPAFNVADVAIVAAAVLIVVALMRGAPRHE